MKIFVTRAIPEAGLTYLRKHADITINPHDRMLTKQEILNGIRGKDGLLCLLTDPIDHDVITAEPKLKMIANYAVGYDNIDIKTATKQGILVSNTPGVLTDTTAELAWSLVFAVARRIVEGDQFIRQGKFRGWEPLLMLGRDIANKTLGIIGTGRIGTAFALKSQGFNMPVLYTDITTNEVLEKQLHAKKVTLNQMLKTADIISVHVSLTPQTHHLIGKDQLQSMKETAILINTARGPIIDENALIIALQNHWIFGAGLDVYEHEPDIPKELLRLPNVVVQPHTGSATYETRSNMAILTAKNLISGIQGHRPPNCVNPEVFTNH
ncbi:MAG: D-glycerate dehydrogenase [Candidatus Thermoplasmatota archaeon]|nr:D-glycerate dehydrogenase [Candidatus Thermoplasmatota archaeon]MBU1940756.1 D-glycerate dehydrogenase [Candidatus Thermoplasmatota archaeon]